jgi:hypothetical protein
MPLLERKYEEEIIEKSRYPIGDLSTEKICQINQGKV